MRNSYKAFDEESGTAVGGYAVRVVLIGIPKLAIIVRVTIIMLTTANVEINTHVAVAIHKCIEVQYVLYS